jgi:hypothetical protein
MGTGKKRGLPKKKFHADSPAGVYCYWIARGLDDPPVHADFEWCWQESNSNETSLTALWKTTSWSCFTVFIAFLYSGRPENPRRPVSGWQCCFSPYHPYFRPSRPSALAGSSPYCRLFPCLRPYLH